jgi:catechol 2,3-dioxygenase-like lactoylglutathione lyase family enzyme
MEASMSPSGDGNVDMKLEAVVIAVSDADRAKEFYASLGWRLDADIAGGALRVIQFNPPGSACSVQFGDGLTTAAPGSAENLLVVADIEAASDDLTDHGVATEVFHDARSVYNRFDPAVRESGPDPERRTYASFAEFRDPDGNLWQLQEITARLPGRVDAATTAFTTASDLADAMRRASVAHGEHEKRIGAADENWPEWYAAYMVAEQSGAELPQ